MSTEFLTKFSDITKAAQALAVDTRERDAVVAEARAMIAEAHGLATKLGVLRAKHLERVAEIHNVDWVAVTKALPNDWVYSKTARTMTSKSRKAVQMLKAAADTAYGSLGSTLGDSQRGTRDIDPVSLADAAECVKLFIEGRDSDMLIDPASQTPSGTYRRALEHLRVWLVRGRSIVASAEQAIEAFDRAEKFAKDVLGVVEPTDVIVGPPKLRLEPLPDAPPAMGTSSYQNFDPRELDHSVPQDDVVVEKIGAGEGLRSRRRGGSR
jgi:hypothetical protein